MAKPNNSIKNIKTPDNVSYEIIPDRLGNGSYVATLPTLDADKVLATTDDIPGGVSATTRGITDTVASGSSDLITSGGVYTSLGAQVIELEDNGSTTAGTWLAKTNKISSLQAGQIFLYKIAVAGATTTKLNISINGKATGAKTIYRTGTTKLTTQYVIDTYILLYFSGTYYYVFNDYDANTDTKVRQYQANATTTALSGDKYSILTRYNQTDKAGSYDATYSKFNTNTYIDVSNGYLYAPKFYSNAKEVATQEYVDTAIDNLPEPMVFKGTLGTGGTITDLPAASSANEGFTYKVITAGTYQSIVCKVGDVVVSNGSAWVLIPAGDIDSDTWRDIDINGSSFKGSAISTGKINFKNGSNVTITGSGNDITIAATDTTYESKSAVSEGTDVSLVTTGEKYIWNNKQDALVSGTNIKTINNESLLGSGNISLDADDISDTSTTNKFVTATEKTYWNNKLDNHCVEVDISEVTPVIDGDLYTFTKNITVEEFNQLINTNTYEIRVTTPQTIGLGTVPLPKRSAYTTMAIFGNVLGIGPQTGTITNMMGFASQTGETQYQFLFTLANNAYQAKLYSGTNIKTINNQSILGSGNMAVQETLVSGTNIKTINNESLLGSGNIEVESGTTVTVNGSAVATFDADTKQDNTVKDYGYSSNWSAKTGVAPPTYGDPTDVGTDGTNVYWSYTQNGQYVLDRSTSTWSTKTWTGFSDITGRCVWSDGNNIYSSYSSAQFVLDKSTSTWSAKTGTGLTSFNGQYIGTDDDNIYYSNGTSQYVLDKATSTWSEKTWTGLTSFRGDYVGTDGENIYYSDSSSQYTLDRATSTWSAKAWTGLTSFRGDRVGTDGDNIYYSYNSDQYVLDKSTSTWSEKTWTGLTSFWGNFVWTDGDNIYYSDSFTSAQCSLDKEVAAEYPFVVTELTADARDDQVPSAKCMYDNLTTYATTIDIQNLFTAIEGNTLNIESVTIANSEMTLSEDQTISGTTLNI